MKTFIGWLTHKWVEWKKKKEFKKKLAELKKRDPFIYKH
jgi:hypothetical protein